jgi:hypothetical protein
MVLTCNKCLAQPLLLSKRTPLVLQLATLNENTDLLRSTRVTYERTRSPGYLQSAFVASTNTAGSALRRSSVAQRNFASFGKVRESARGNDYLIAGETFLPGVKWHFSWTWTRFSRVTFRCFSRIKHYNRQQWSTKLRRARRIIVRYNTTLC